MINGVPVATADTASPTAGFFDRHFHAAMAWFFVLVAITGFAPRSLAIVSGRMPVPPLVVHLHAVLLVPAYSSG